MEISEKTSNTFTPGSKFYDLGTKRLLDIDRDSFHYTFKDLSDQLSYGKSSL